MLPTIPRDGLSECYYYSQFSDENTEAQSEWPQVTELAGLGVP